MYTDTPLLQPAQTGSRSLLLPFERSPKNGVSRSAEHRKPSQPRRWETSGRRGNVDIARFVRTLRVEGPLICKACISGTVRVAPAHARTSGALPRFPARNDRCAGGVAGVARHSAALRCTTGGGGFPRLPLARCLALADQRATSAGALGVVAAAAAAQHSAAAARCYLVRSVRAALRRSVSHPPRLGWPAVGEAPLIAFLRLVFRLRRFKTVPLLAFVLDRAVTGHDVACSIGGRGGQREVGMNK